MRLVDVVLGLASGEYFGASVGAPRWYPGFRAGDK